MYQERGNIETSFFNSSMILFAKRFFQSRNMLKSVILFLMISGICNNVNAKNKGSEPEEGYQFTLIKELPHTPIENQNSSSTCWSFSGLGFLESEMLRLGKPEVNLSEMFVVWHTYSEKSEKYVRMHGNLTFSPGGAFHDVTHVIEEYGIVPESVYSGLKYGEEKHVHSEMDKVLKEHVKAVVENGNRKLSTAWEKSIRSTLNSYLGELPESFEYEGEEYTPQSFARDYVGLNMNDYVELTSYTHHPFYEKFVLEIPDNWMWGEIYNIPLEELDLIISNAIDNDFTVAWAADVSEKGFSSTSDGVAIIPEVNLEEMSNSEQRKWERMSDSERDEELYTFEGPSLEKEITQELRQIGFDNYQTTDDHGMLIVGKASDQDGNIYYKVKNSWGDYNDFGGYFYASESYVQYKTMSIMVHKDAIPRDIQRKLGL